MKTSTTPSAMLKRTLARVVGLAILALTTATSLLAQTYVAIGTSNGSNGSTTYPTPFGDYYESNRAQYLYRASELTAAGLVSGSAISAIRWNVTALNGSGSHEGYTVKVGTTTTASLAAAYLASPTTIYGPTNYTPVLGNNTFTISTPIMWNGTDNILVEICHSSPIAGVFLVNTYTNNATVAWQSGLSFNGSYHRYQDNVGTACSSTTLTNTATQTTRPQIILGYIPPPANDACANAVIIGSMPFTSAVVNNVAATNDVPTSTCTGPYKNLWWRVTPALCGSVTAQTCPGSNFDTELAVFTGACGSFTQVGCNDDGGAPCTGLYSAVTWTATTGTTYYISVGSYGPATATGNIQLGVTTTATDTDTDGIGNACDNCVSTSNATQTNTDGDALGDACDPDDDNDGVADATDPDDTTPDICGDADGDGCDDCSVGTDNFGPLADNLVANDGLDTDLDGLCNSGDADDDNDGTSDTAEITCGSNPLNAASTCEVCDGVDNDLDSSIDEGFSNTDGDSQADCMDADDDNDGVLDGSDNAPLNTNSCEDLDGDGCDDCAGTHDGFGPLANNDPADDGPDNDADGLCDSFDTDDDNDGITDASEITCGSNPFNAASTCEVCDGVDNDLDSSIDEGFANTDGDGQADCMDGDDDNDGVADVSDPQPLNTNLCGLDSDGDGCDDCAGVLHDGFGPLANNNVADDGTDTDGDGDCDSFDTDDDNDGISDIAEIACGSNPNNAASTCEVCDGVDNDLDASTDEGFANTDGDGQADCMDGDDDNDGVADVSDPQPLNTNLCGLDSDGDGCDDCAGVLNDGFGPLANNNVADDGTDTDGDGDCDSGDICPTVANGSPGDACNDGNPNTTADQLGASTGCTCAGVACTVNGFVVFDNLDGSNLRWSIRQQGTNILTAYSPGYPAYFSYPVATQYSDPFCLPDGCYYLTVEDQGGNGIAGGGYKVLIGGKRAIDNASNFLSGATSAIAGNEGLCVVGGAIGTDQLIWASRDREDWRTTPCTPDVIWTNNTGAARYRFWFYDPNGGASFYGPTSSGGTSNSLSLGVVPVVNGVLYNVRVQTKATTLSPWSNHGPSSRLRVDNTLAQCRKSKLYDDPGFPSKISCGANKPILTGNQSNSTNQIWTRPVTRMNANCVAVDANKYQFRFRIPAENITFIMTSQGSNPWTYLNATTNAAAVSCTGAYKLVLCKTYEVEVRASFDNGATWCVGAADPCDLSGGKWGDVCLLTTAGCLTGGDQRIAEESNSTLRMYPNPNRGDQLYLMLDAIEEGVQTVSVDIFDTFGKRVDTRTILVTDGFINTVMDLNGEMAAGMYMVNITAGGATYNQRLVIQP